MIAGIGVSGITIEGKILEGKNLLGVDWTAVEIEHICIEPFGAIWGCGSQGYLKQHSSLTAVVEVHLLFNYFFV